MKNTNSLLVFGFIALLSACDSTSTIESGTYQSGVDGVEPNPPGEPVELLHVDAKNMQVQLQLDGKIIQEFTASPTG